jgi:ribosome recycling factor
MDIIEQTKSKMTAALEHLKHELKAIRTGRANPSMLDGVMVEVYGSPMRLKDIASVTAPEARQLLISPFDAANVHAIGKGIERANIGVVPIVDGNVVRIKISPMDENVRKEMVKLCHKRREEAKVSIRNIRRDSNDGVRKKKNDGDIPDDLMKKFEKQIQELTDKFCKEADDISEKKEKEVLTI